MSKRILLIEASDFEGYPTGGSCTFSQNMIKSFGNNVALVGITTLKNDRIGCWTKKSIKGIEYDYLPLRYVRKRKKGKPIIPERLTWYFALRFWRKAILNYDCPNVFVQSPDTLLAIHNWGIPNICYRFAGLTNPLRMSRYTWARLFGAIFEYFFLASLKNVNVFLAAASNNEIDKYSNKLCQYGIKVEIIQYPTRVDTEIFYPMLTKESLRIKMGFGTKERIVVTSGRLSGVKGWPLLMDSFSIFIKSYPDSVFIFVGNGEDRDKIEDYVERLGIKDRVCFVGFLDQEHLSEYLNIADLYVMGSYFEGWPTSMIEAVSCCIPVCSTNFESAKEILISDKIGIIIPNRNPNDFARGMIDAIERGYLGNTSCSEASKYAVNRMRESLLEHWTLL